MILADSLQKRGYEAPCLVGKGAFAEVYRVKSKREGKHYACKTSRHKSLIFREAEFLAELDYPLFPRFYEVWQEEDTGFLVMEYVPGRSLESLLKSRKNLSAGQAVRIAAELAEGFVCLHERPAPILYRDLKPHNIQIREDGRVKLLDFGCACRMDGKTAACVRVGSPGYAAPEQLLGEEMGVAGDIYAFGRVVQCMLSSEEKRGRGREENLLFTLAKACTEKEPGRRPAAFRLCLYLLADCMERDFLEKYQIEKYIFHI